MVWGERAESKRTKERGEHLERREVKKNEKRKYRNWLLIAREE